MPIKRNRTAEAVDAVERAGFPGADPVVPTGKIPPALGVANKKALAEMRIEYVDIDTIHLWKENPRKNEKAAPQVAQLIEEHGIKSPLVVWRKDRTIYKGNTTYKALRLLNWKMVPVIFHDFPTKAAATAYGIADNKASEYAGWDREVLAGIMKSDALVKHAGDAEGMKRTTGFSEREIDGIFNPKQGTEAEDLVSGKHAFVVVEFPNKEDFATFKKKVSGAKVITFAQLNEGMGYYAE
jgi:hypothetical protein